MANRRKLVRRIVLGCGLAVAIALVVRSLLRPTPLDVSNGKLTYLVEADLGSVRYSSDNAAQAYLRDKLPLDMWEHLGRVDQLSTSGHIASNGVLQLVLVFHHAGGGDGNFLERVELQETTGYTFNNIISGPTIRPWNLASFVVPRFPRRDPKLNCRFYERGTGKFLGAVKFANPGYRPDYPAWTPDELPTTKTVGPVSVTARGFREETDPVDNMPALDLAINTTWDKLTHAVVYEDATGNTDGALSPFEAAWKAKVTVRRTVDASFSDAERWDLDSIPIPIPLHATATRARLHMLNQKQTIDGIPVEVHFLQPPRQSRPGFAQFWVTYSELPRDVDLLTIVRDQEGRLLNDPPASLAEGSRKDRYVNFSVKPESTAIQLTVIVNRSRTVEFLVAPPEELRQAVRARLSATNKSDSASDSNDK